MRDRLIALIRSIPNMEPQCRGRAQGKTYLTAAHIADHLLANGVIVPPCKVGDRVWVHIGLGNIIAAIVTRVETTETPNGAKRSYFAIGVESPSVSFNDDCIGKTVFLNSEEAEKALAERSAE